MLASHAPRIQYTNKTAGAYWRLDSDYDKVWNISRQCISRDEYTGFNKNILQPGPHMTVHLFLLSVSNVYHQRLGATHRLPEKGQHRTQIKNEIDFLQIYDIHPDGSDPLSHAACLISVISRLMRLEVITCHLKHLTTIHFECHIVIPVKSQIYFFKNTIGIKLRGMNSSTTKRKYV